MQNTRMVFFSPGRILLASLFFIISLGTILLSLPFCQAESVSFFDAFFTSVSTTCVTGMLTIPISSFNSIGHIVILILMQIGGLGLMTFSFFLASLFSNMGMTTKLIAGKLFDFESWSNVKDFLQLIISITLGIEFIGAVVLFTSFYKTMPIPQAIFYSIFHSVSAFCNAGLCLFDGSIQSFNNDSIVLSTLAALVIAGGIGFIVWYELFRFASSWFARMNNTVTPLFSFSLHSRLVLITSTTLVIGGGVLIWGIERMHSLQKMDAPTGILNAFFMSISMRSAGFYTINLEHVSGATMLLLMLLMVIGASPSSTGSGIKTTTFALFWAAVSAIMQNRSDVEIFGRTIPADLMYKVIAVIAIAISWITSSMFVMLLLHPGISTNALLVEVVSAFTTCGISLGITNKLTLIGQIILLLTMVVGRIGLLTLVLAIKKNKTKHLYRYPEERVLIG